MAVGIQITLNERLYLRDPQQTALGKKIIKHSILLIDQIGFEAFTFKKLAQAMQSTEASFTVTLKIRLLLYLVSWFWEWQIHLIDINTKNIDDPVQRLKIIISTLCFASKENPSIEYVNESVCIDSSSLRGRSPINKSVDDENKEGFEL